MATKRTKELRNLTQDELTSRLRETESQLFKNKMQLRTGQLADTASLWKLRKDVARIKTLQSQGSKLSKGAASAGAAPSKAAKQ